MIRRRGPRPLDTFAIPARDGGVLDEIIQPLLRENPGCSGVRLVADGEDALLLRAMSARLAVRSLDLQTYIWRDDLTGRYLAREVLAAADRGVRVRLLLDDMDARLRRTLLAALDRHPNIDIRLFNPFTTRSGTLRTLTDIFAHGSRLNHRMHNKSWCVDRRVALVGGRNVGDEYFAYSADRDFIDLDLLLLGDAVEATVAAFDRYWNSEVSLPMSYLRLTSRNRISMKRLRRKLDDSAAGSGVDAAQSHPDLPAAAALLHGPTGIQWCSDVRVVVDDPRKATHPGERPDPGVLESMVAALGAARQRLQIISPYFVPGPAATAVLQERVRVGVAVSVLTNSLAATDVAAVHSGYARYRPALLEGGVALYELKPSARPRRRPRHLRLGSSRASLHTKAAVVDEGYLFVGSFNIDPRSAMINCEMGVWVWNEVLTAQLARLFEEGTRPAHCLSLDLDERGRIRWTDQVAGVTRSYRSDPYAGHGRRLLAWLLGLLPLESQL